MLVDFKKLSKYGDGYYWIKRALIVKEGAAKDSITGVMVEKKGNQVSYFGTNYFDKADEIEGVFKHIKVDSL